MTALRRQVKKVFVGILGGLVVLIGIILIPSPGPGWLIIFFGLTILATEFMWAQGLLDNLQGRYDTWQEWMKRQTTAVRAFFWLMTAIAVVLAIWLFNGYGLLNEWLGLGQDWLNSPFVQIDPTP